jgi:hypothetical protein
MNSSRARLSRSVWNTRVYAFALAAAGLFPLGVPAQDRTNAQGPTPNKSPAAGGAEPAGAEAARLDEVEASLGRRYRQFEQTLLQMAAYLRKTEPERADLLIRAIGKSKEERILQQMEQIGELLKSDQLGDAIGRQEHLVGNLKTLLDLLQSEDRRHQLEEEKKWYEMLQREVGKLSAREKDLRRATEDAGKFKPLEDRQGRISGDTKSLLDKIEKQDAARNGSKAGKSAQPHGDSKKSDPDAKGQNDDGKKNDATKDAKNDDKKTEDGKTDDPRKDNKADDGKQGNSSEKSQKKDQKQNGKSAGKSQNRNADKKPVDKQNGSQGAPGQPSEEAPPPSPGDESSEQEPQNKSPGREEIEQARRAMQQAEEELKRLKADKAIEKEEDAIRKLAEAKEKLEKILRQLREEEQEIMLASLEARFARMLLMQIQIASDTGTLSKTAKGAWTATHFGRSRELSVQEDAIAVDAAKALALLKEEGSSVAFPKGVEQVRDDMLTIARSLEKNDVGELTQTIEKDVIEALEELVTALQSEIENRKKPEAQRKRQQAGQQQQGNQLVQQLAELKMLRSLQMRVNRRTKQLGRMIKGEQASTEDLSKQLRNLAQRQAEIQEATYTLVSGRNQ